LQFDGLVFEGARGEGVQAYSTVGTTFSNCEARYCGSRGWRAEKVTDFTIVGGSTHDCPVEAGLVQGGDKATLTDGRIVIERHSTYNIGLYMNGSSGDGAWANRVADNATGQSCGTTWLNCSFYNILGQAICDLGAHVTIDGCSFDRVCLAMGDAGAIYTVNHFTNRGKVVQNCTFSNIQPNPITNPVANGYASVFGVYFDNAEADGTIQDCIFTNCDHAILLNGGKDFIVRRNKFTGCVSGHNQSAITIGSMVGNTSTVDSQSQPDLALWPLTSPPWSTNYAWLQQLLPGGTRYSTRTDPQNRDTAYQFATICAQMPTDI
jgi:hypothetical protein